MIEEPELFLRPHHQRALYRLLREFSAGGNQVLYSTHEASFLNVARLEELALVERDATGLTRIRRPTPLAEADAFRAVSEFDAERSELLLARAALLVEGRTEKLVFPFLFRALGYDPDREGISIVECGGKPNIPVIAGVCNRVGVPYLVVHDRDAASGRRPIASEVAVNDAIARVAGPDRVVELARDFEQVAQLHGHRHKPERAWHWFAEARSADDVPPELAEVVRRTVALAGADARPG
jgi:predicted ATP-dependent endonuclease of OLD family